VKGVRVQGEVAHLSLGDDEAGLIASLIEVTTPRSQSHAYATAQRARLKV
jgi:hypothetical protein